MSFALRRIMPVSVNENKKTIDKNCELKIKKSNKGFTINRIFKIGILKLF